MKTIYTVEVVNEEQDRELFAQCDRLVDAIQALEAASEMFPDRAISLTRVLS